jgi:hypothetical protein
LQSGADTSTKCGIVSVPQVTVAAGGKLDIESLQESRTYNSREKQFGGSAAIGTAKAGGFPRSVALSPLIDPPITRSFCDESNRLQAFGRQTHLRLSNYRLNLLLLSKHLAAEAELNVNDDGSRGSRYC